MVGEVWAGVGVTLCDDRSDCLNVLFMFRSVFLYPVDVYLVTLEDLLVSSYVLLVPVDVLLDVSECDGDGFSPENEFH